HRAKARRDQSLDPMGYSWIASQYGLARFGSSGEPRSCTRAEHRCRMVGRSIEKQVCARRLPALYPPRKNQDGNEGVEITWLPEAGGPRSTHRHCTPSTRAAVNRAHTDRAAGPRNTFSSEWIHFCE